ncbi:hypothetical protein D3C72_2061940 [compost metagenome]
MLSLIETMDLVDKEDGFLLELQTAVATCFADFAQSLGTRIDSIQIYKVCLEVLRQSQCKGGLASAWRTPDNETWQIPLAKHLAEFGLCTECFFLAKDFVQVFGTKDL